MRRSEEDREEEVWILAGMKEAEGKEEVGVGIEGEGGEEAVEVIRDHRSL